MTRQGRGSKHRSLVLLAATAAAFGLLAGACGGGSSDNNSGGTTTPSGSVAPETAAPGGSEAPTSEAGSTTAPAAQATPGGKVIMGIEADTSSPVDAGGDGVRASRATRSSRASTTRCVVPNQDGGWSPYLAREPHARTPTTRCGRMKARPGITFHDGTPLDGAALADNVTRFQKGILTGAYFSNVDSATVNPTDPLAVDVKMKTPWVTVPRGAPHRPDRLHRLADVDGGGRQGRDPEVQARRHRPVHLRGLQAQRVLQGQEEPELLEQALPVPGRDRVPSHPGRAEPPRRARRAAPSTSSTPTTARSSPSSATTRTSRRRRSATTPRPATRSSTSRRSCRTAPIPRSQDQRVRCALANAWDQPHDQRDHRAGRLPDRQRSVPARARRATWRTPASRRSRTWPRPRR